MGWKQASTLAGAKGGVCGLMSLAVHCTKASKAGRAALAFGWLMIATSTWRRPPELST